MVERTIASQNISDTNEKTCMNAAALVCAAAFILLIFKKAAISPLNQTGMIHGLNYNIVVYAISVLGAFAVYLIAACLEHLFFRIAHAHHAEKAASRIASVFSWITAVLFLAYIYRVYADEPNNFPDSPVTDSLRQKISHPLYFAIICITALLFFLIARHASRLHTVVLRWIMILAGAFFTAFLLWCPNPYYDQGGTMLHIHAYTNSIANVTSLVPFSRLNMSIYGHYALLYLPFVKLFGSGYTAVALSISLFGFLTFLFAGYAAYKTIRNDVLFFLTELALIGTVSIMNRRGQYYQTNPHRLLTTSFCLAYIVWKEFHIKNDNALRIRLLEVVIGILAVTWNLETGLFGVCTIALARILKQLSDHCFLSGAFWKEVLWMFADLILSFFGAWVLVGVYNCLVGGSFTSIRTFIYPFLSGNYNVNHLRLPLRGWTALSTLEIILFSLTAFTCIAFAWKKQIGNRRILMQTAFAASVSGLMNLLYFMNRTAYGNIQISHIQLVILAGIAADHAVSTDFSLISKKKAKPQKEKTPETGLFAYLISGVIYIGIFFLAVEGVLAIPISVTHRRNAHSQELSTADVWYEQIRQNVPKDTFAYGIGIPEAYMSLHWDTGCHMIDLSDMNAYNNAYLESRIAKEKAVLTTDADFAAKHPEFEAKGSWTAYYCTATYYVRR